jgi:hypothetical protein
MITLLIEIKVDTEKFDVSSYTHQAVLDGWGNDPENGVWYLAQEIADSYSAPGCQLEVLP